MDNFLDNFLESIDDSIDSYYIEKQTREEYAKRRFKEKYKYDPKEKTIEVDGEKIKVDANLDKGQKGKTTKAGIELIEYIDKNGIIPKKKYKVVEAERKGPKERDTSASLRVKQVSLDDDYWKTDARRKNTGLSHELGHIKLHNIQYSDPELKSKEVLKKLKDEEDRLKKQERKKERQQWDEKLDKAFNKPGNKEVFDKHPIIKSGLRKGLHGMLSASHLEDDIKDKVTDHVEKKIYTDTGVSKNDSERAKLRSSAMDKLKKYEKLDKSGHAKMTEFEADLYAANKHGEKAVRRELRAAYRQARKSKKKELSKLPDKKEAKRRLTEYNKATEADYNARAKVLKSKDKILTRTERENYR